MRTLRFKDTTSKRKDRIRTFKVWSFFKNSNHLTREKQITLINLNDLFSSSLTWKLSESAYNCMHLKIYPFIALHLPWNSSSQASPYWPKFIKYNQRFIRTYKNCGGLSSFSNLPNIYQMPTLPCTPLFIHRDEIIQFLPWRTQVTHNE